MLAAGSGAVTDFETSGNPVWRLGGIPNDKRGVFFRVCQGASLVKRRVLWLGTCSVNSVPQYHRLPRLLSRGGQEQIIEKGKILI